MADARHKGSGSVKPLSETSQAREAARQRRNDPDYPRERFRVQHPNAEGLRVHMAPVRGLTPKRVMRHRFNFQLPPLDQFGYNASHSHNDFETIGRGTYSRKGAKQLLRVDFETLVMDGNPGFAVYHGRAQPQDAAKQLQRICNHGEPFRLVCGQEKLWGQPDINMLATLRDVGVLERAGEPDARYFSLSFVEYREPRIRRRQRRQPRLPTTVKVFKSGKVSGVPGKFEIGPNRPATLARIARVFYGNTRSVRALRRANPRLAQWPANADLGLFVSRKRGGEMLKLRVPEKKKD